MNENEPPPVRYPPWVKKEILLPVFGVLLIGLMFGSWLVIRDIKRQGRYSPDTYGPMDHRPSTRMATPVETAATNTTNGAARSAVDQLEATQ